MTAKRASRRRAKRLRIPRKNPFVADEPPRKPWTPLQRASIKKAFDSKTRKSRADAIASFVENTEQTFEYLRVDGPLGEVAEKLERPEGSARELRNALSSCANHEARRWVGGLLYTYIRWSREWREPDGRIPAHIRARIQALQPWSVDQARQFAADLRILCEGRTPRDLLGQLWTLATLLQVAAHQSHCGLPMQRSLTRENRLKVEVVRLLKNAWIRSFGTRPSYKRNGEFQRVTVAFGEMLGIRIGWRVVSRPLGRSSINPP